MEVITFMDGGFSEPPAPQRKKRITKTRVLIALGVLALAITGAGLAAWLISSNGQFQSKAGNLTAPTVTPYSGGPADLWPGDGASSIGIHVVNSASHALKLVSMQASATVKITASDTVGCPNGNILWNGTDASSAIDQTLVTFTTPIAVPVGATDIVIPATAFPAGKGLSMAATAPTGCQNVTLAYLGNPNTFSFNFSS